MSRFPVIGVLARRRWPMAAAELDPVKRTAMMSQALGLAKDDVAIISLHQQPLAWAVRDGVHLKVTADNKPRLWYATIA